MRYNKFIILIFIQIVFLTAAFAQPKDSDPYSLLGIGTLQTQDFTASQAMGGVGAVYHDPFRLNASNPAAAGFLQLTSFEASGFFKYATLKTDNATFDARGGGFGYLALGFPFQNVLNEQSKREKSKLHWGTNISLATHSQVAYDIESWLRIPIYDSVATRYTGTGGLTKLMWNNGVRYKNISVGVGIGYLFGKQAHLRKEEFYETSFSSDNYRLTEYHAGGLIWNLGAIYEHTFKQTEAEVKQNKPKKHLSVGVYGNSGATLNTDGKLLYYSISPLSSIPDTIFEQNNRKGEIKMPSELGVGLMYHQENKFKLAANYNFTPWSQYENDLRNSNLLDAWKISVGGEITPDSRSYNRYAKRMSYRVGGFYSTDPRNYNGQLKQAALTAGVGFPFLIQRTVPSFLDLNLEFGKYTGSTVLTQNYFKVTLGLTMNDNTWFYKRKYE